MAGNQGNQYVLGTQPEELARLELQAKVIERPTRLLLQAAGLQPGMRVLDLGTGLGHVARLVGELVGPTGSVVGVDRSPEMLTVARERTLATGATHITFTEGDATVWTAPNSFDAIVGRLVLFHVPDPAAVVRHQLANLRRGGLFVAIDFDIGGSRSEPPVATADRALRWIMEAFRAAGAWPRIGASLGTILEDAGVSGTTTLGIQAYLSSRDAAGPLLITGVLRSLAPVIVRCGIATEEELGLATFEERLREETRQARAVILPPTVVGAWGHTLDA